MKINRFNYDVPKLNGLTFAQQTQGVSDVDKKENRNNDQGWPYRCRKHNQPTALLCSKCLKEPLCAKCYRYVYGLGFLCPTCEARLIGRTRDRQRMWS